MPGIFSRLSKKSNPVALNTSGKNPNIFENSILTSNSQGAGAGTSIMFDALEQQKVDTRNSKKMLADAHQLYSSYRKVEDPYIESAETFNITDLHDGKPGIRHGGKVNKQVLRELVSGAAKEGVDIDVALATGMRETGLGNVHAVGQSSTYQVGLQYSPMHVMQAWDAKSGIKGMPMDYEAYMLRNNLVPKENIEINKGGYFIKNTDNVDAFDIHNNPENIQKYSDYMNSFEYDKSLNEPFRKEMRFLKKRHGKAYNPGEIDRDEKLAYDLTVIKENKDMYGYALAEYNKALEK